jgi:hypothetical protein
MKKRTNFAHFLLIMAFVAGMLGSVARPANAAMRIPGDDRNKIQGEIMPPPRFK